MELDFSNLFNDSVLDIPESPQKPAEGAKLNESEKQVSYSQKEETKQEGALNGLNQLQKQADEKQRVFQEAVDILQEYQERATATETLRAQILKGLQTGENIAALFLMAAKAYSFCIDNNEFFDQALSSIVDVYGEALKEEQPLQLAIRTYQKRLDKLEAALEQETRESNRGNLNAAIRAHKSKIEELQADLEKQQKTE